MRFKTTIPMITTLLLLVGCGLQDKHIDLAKQLDGALVNRDGQPLPAGPLLDTDYLLLYFSAHWCPPCQAFTPQLVQFYNTRGGGRRFHVLFISSDHTENEMYGYMREAGMPWPAVRYRSEAARAVHDSYGNTGIPQLVLLDPQGKVLADSFKGRQYLGPQQVLDQLSKRLGSAKSAPDSTPPETTQITTGDDEPVAKPDNQLASLQVTGLFVQNTGESGALINGSFFHEGDMPAPGIVVEKITSTYVEVSHEGRRYRLVP